MRPSVKEVKSFIVFHNHVNVMIYSALSSADDPLMIIQLMVERGRSTGGAGAEDPLERAQKLHLVDQIHIGLLIYRSLI